MEINNRKAYHDYFVEESLEAGIVLTGTEIKSLRTGSANIKDSYAIIKNNEIFLLNMFIAPYKQGNIFNHQERRTRKLLVHKKEIKHLKEKIEMQGMTLIPLKVFLKEGKAKVLVGICRGKKNYDKREALKEKEQRREMEKMNKYRNR